MKWPVSVSLAVGLFTLEAAPADKVLFEDDFNGKLGAGWSWVREHRQSWRVIDQGLEVRVEPGNMWGPPNNARNVLLRSAPDVGEDEIEISVNVENKPTEQYEQVDLVWYYDDGHMVKVGEELVDGKLSVVMGREENDRTRTISITPLDSPAVQLRMVVSENLVRGSFKTPQGEWREVGQCDLPAKGEPKISLQFYQGPQKEEHWARVSDFKVRKL